MINTVTPDKSQKDKENIQALFEENNIYGLLGDEDTTIQRLKQLLLSLEFKRRNHCGGCPRSRFVIRLSQAGVEPHQGLALQFLSSIFNDRDIIKTLNPEVERFGIDTSLSCQMTIFVLAETNAGVEEVLALAHVKFYPNVGILVKWLAVTGTTISKQKFGEKADGGSWRNRGLSTLLLNSAESIGANLYKGLIFPRIFVEVRADAVDAHAFYKKKGFVMANKFPACVEKDLLQNYTSTLSGGGAMLLDHEAISHLQKMELTSTLVRRGD